MWCMNSKGEGRWLFRMLLMKNPGTDAKQPNTDFTMAQRFAM